jgi:hypothetical protein
MSLVLPSGYAARHGDDLSPLPCAGLRFGSMPVGMSRSGRGGGRVSRKVERRHACVIAVAGIEEARAPRRATGVITFVATIRDKRKPAGEGSPAGLVQQIALRSRYQRYSMNQLASGT